MQMNEIISYEPNTVTFYNDSLTAIKDNDGEIWALINDILRNIGFDEKKIDNQRTAWLKDIVISRGTKILDLQINGYKRQANCLNRRYIPLALAKISITPTMQREQPEVVNKLIQYQEECADVLYRYFYKGNDLSNEVPLSREEMAMYWTNMMAMFRDYTQILERREKSRDEVLDKVISNQAELYKSLSLSQKLYQDVTVNLSDVIKEMKDRSATPVLPKENIVEKPFATPKLTANSWINEANNSVLSITKKSHKDIPAQYREVYALMRKNGYKINKVTGSKIIDVISENKKLRDGFNTAINDLNKKYKVKAVNTTNQSYVCKSVLIKQIPEGIMTEIKAYAKKKNISYKLACGRIYERIEELGKLSLDSMMREYSHKIGFSKCSKYYMIANNKYLMDLFNKVMQEA